jgi:nitrate/nitrite-specific signal transduction histidine kinase
VSRIIGAFALALALCLSWGLWQRGQAIAARGEARMLQTDLAAERAARAQSDQAAAVLRAHFARIAAEDAQWRDLDADLRKMEGRDAPLSPLLRSAAERLWGQ